MITLYLVLPLALVIGTLSVIAFVWTVRSGQLDDLETPPQRLLLEDAPRANAALARGQSAEPAPPQNHS